MMDEILEQFLGEARDNLDYLDSHLKDLDGGNDESINALFRAAHTLKGGAGLVGLTHIKEITHAAEDLLDAYRNKKITYSDEMLDTLYDAFDEVIELIDATEESGSDADADEEHIQKIKHSILAFLGSSDSDDKDEVELPFELDDSIFLDNLTNDQLEELVPNLIKDVKIDDDFITKENYWVIDLNLASDTIELGNDPFYLLSMIGEDNLIAVSTEVINPDDFSDILALKTHLKIVCLSDVENIEDVFYNIIDEITAYPLTLDALIHTDKESIQNDTYTSLLNDIKKDGLTNISHKLKTALNVINPNTKEGFLVDRLLNISSIDETLVKDILNKLGIELTTKATTDTNDEKVSQKVEQKSTLGEKEKQSTISILKAQQMALKTDGALERVKFVLKKVAVFLDVDKKDIDSIEEVDELNSFITNMIDSLLGKAQTTSKQPKEIEKEDAEKPKEIKSEHIKEKITPPR